MADLIPTPPLNLPTSPSSPPASETSKVGWLDSLKSVKWGAVLIEDGALSLGRVMGWIVFAGLLYLWMARSQEPPMSMVETFWALLVYNANKKVVGPLTTFFHGRRGGGAGSPTPVSPAWAAVAEAQSPSATVAPPAGATVIKKAPLPPPPSQEDGVKVTVISDQD
jgi:hypothetical protein